MARNRYKISDIASLYSLVQWEKIKSFSDEETGKYMLFVPSQPNGIRIGARMIRDEKPTQNGFVTIINKAYKEVVIPQYLGFELMSIAAILR